MCISRVLEGLVSLMTSRPIGHTIFTTSYSDECPERRDLMENSSLRLNDSTLSLLEHGPVAGLYISSHLLKEGASLRMAEQD